MIVWINGSFGSGKTSVANALDKRLENSYVFDPEEVGFLIRDNIPSELKNNDFQDFHLWREFNYSMLSYLSTHYDGTIIVPMTIIKRQYLDEILGKLKCDGVFTKHFTLVARKDTLVERLTRRGDGDNTWATSRVDGCVQSLEDEYFEEHIVTDNLLINEVAEVIADSCKLRLLPKDDV